jgi:copper chaperone CopZ
MDKQQQRFDIPTDRRGAAETLGQLAPAIVGEPLAEVPRPQRIEFARTPIEVGDNGLTDWQDEYRVAYMQPCPAELLTSAPYRLTWKDSLGVVNQSYFADALGPIVPVAAREAELRLAAQFERAHGSGVLDSLSQQERDALAATTTDVDPVKIFKVGADAARKVLTQYALLADSVGQADPVEFAQAVRGSKFFSEVARRNYWELMAATDRRAAVTGSIVVTDQGVIAFDQRSREVLAEMKANTIAQASRVLEDALDAGMTEQEAVEKYYREDDEASAQYMRLRDGEVPACIGLAARVPGTTINAVEFVGDLLVSEFVDQVSLIDLRQVDSIDLVDHLDRPEADLLIPSMACMNCVTRIGKILGKTSAHDVEIDLETKVARVRFDSFDELRAAIETLGQSYAVAGVLAVSSDQSSRIA